jgi:glucosamine--fructose-6-phosphate aminotransferase (isomerizing)
MTRPFIEAVLAQPAELARSAALVRAALAGPAGTAARAALGGRRRIAAIGMGASAAAATGFAAVLRDSGRAAVALDPAACVPAMADGYLAISSSGRSRETVEALTALGAGTPKVALTNDSGSPLAAAADVVLPLGCGTDSRVSTLSYTASLQALGLLAGALADASSTVDAADSTASTVDLSGAAAAVLATGIEPAVDALAPAGCVDVVGAGPRAASAMAAALLLREAAHLPAAGYATREYLHGHLEVAGPGHAALVFGAGRELRLAADLARYGSSVVLITDAVTDADVPAEPGLCVVRLPALPGLAGCVLDILPVQLAARRLAQRRGLPIALRHMPDDTKLPGA